MRQIQLTTNSMDAVHEAEEPIDVGVCPIYNRVYEGYCTKTNVLVCPSCIMFGDHRGHPVVPIDEGAKILRSKINEAAKQGVLKFERTESILLDIRHAKLSLEENQQSILKQAEKHYDDLISTLKARRGHFLNQLRNHFQNQIDCIDTYEEQWVQKQELSQKILKLQTSKDDMKLLEQSKKIVDGLEALAKPVEYREIQLIEGVESEAILGKARHTFKELQDTLREYLKAGRTIVNRIRC